MGPVHYCVNAVQLTLSYYLLLYKWYLTFISQFLENHTITTTKAFNIRHFTNSFPNSVQFQIKQYFWVEITPSDYLRHYRTLCIITRFRNVLSRQLTIISIKQPISTLVKFRTRKTSNMLQDLSHIFLLLWRDLHGYGPMSDKLNLKM